MANDHAAPGDMSMLLLALLKDRDICGYKIVKALRTHSNEVFRLKMGILCPLFRSLEAQS